MRHAGYYKLVDRVAVPCTLREWGEYFQSADRYVALTDVSPDCVVSTVFMGIPLGLTYGPPVLFETLVFCGDAGMTYQERCATWDEALAMHARAVYWLTERNAKGSK